MLNKILTQLGTLDSRTLEENVQLCGQLELAIKNWRSWRTLARAVHRLLFCTAGALFIILLWVETLMEAGRGTEIPPMFNPVSPRTLTEADTLVLYWKYFSLILILLILAASAGIILAVKYRGTKSLPSAELKIPPEDEQLSYLESSLERAYSALSSSSGILQHVTCALFALAVLYLCVTMDLVGQLKENVTYYIGIPLLMFAFYEAAFLISALPMWLLFFTTKEQSLLYKLKTVKLSQYKGTLREEARNKEEEARRKEEEARVAAMTPAERRQYEWLKQKEEERKQRAAAEHREKERKEKEKMEQWMATHRLICRFCIEGVCTYKTTAYEKEFCYYSTPAMCYTAKLNNGLTFVEK